MDKHGGTEAGEDGLYKGRTNTPQDRLNVGQERRAQKACGMSSPRRIFMLTEMR